jgi:hypothetical protein
MAEFYFESIDETLFNIENITNISIYGNKMYVNFGKKEYEYSLDTPFTTYGMVLNDIANIKKLNPNINLEYRSHI